MKIIKTLTIQRKDKIMNRNRREGSHPTIVEAVETLSSIAEMDFDRDVGVVEIPEVGLEDKNVTHRIVQRFQHQNAEATVNDVKEIFRVILNYLRSFYRKKYRLITNPQTIEGIKDIMVLVGEAAKKLDKYTSLFPENKKKSVTQLKEFKKLQEFYLTRIARKIDESVLSQWIMALSKQLLAQQEVSKQIRIAKRSPAKHIFVDLDSVKKDTEYELFFIRKEDGTRFFNPRIIRNIKLVCDFGDYFETRKEDDPLESVNIWQCQNLQVSANNILNSLGSSIDNFLHEVKKAKNLGDLDRYLNKALVALMLASNPHNLSLSTGLKSCSNYFKDFQLFLREALHTREYQKYNAYPPSKSNKYACALLDLTHALCYSLFVNSQGLHELKPNISRLLREANLESSLEYSQPLSSNQYLSDRLSSDFAAMGKLLKRHPNGPLIKLLKVLEDGLYQVYDPLFQENIPNQLFALDINDKKVINIRIPGPFYQEFINKPCITEEFKSFLRSAANKHGHLLINFQDRTSWREHARCIVLEDLQNNPDFSDKLTVVTISKDTEFYNQLAPYNEDNHAHSFIKHFKEHLQDESCGFYYPKSLMNELFPSFVDGAMEAVHRIFFGGKNVLLRNHRLDFIEIFYLFLELKIIALVQPNTVSFTCKDGVDIGVAASAELLIFMKWLDEEQLSEQDVEQLNLILYGPPIMIRERTMLTDRFNRMQSMIRTLEIVRKEHGWKEFVDIIRNDFAPYLRCKVSLDKVS